MTDSAAQAKTRVVPSAMLFPFILTTTLFALWGFANDITNPMGSLLGMVVASKLVLRNLKAEKYFASLLLTLLAAAGAVLTALTILPQNQTGLVCLVGVSACMSLMFPTIYGIALDGLGEDAKLGSAGLIFAIVGGALMPMGAGWFIDQGTVNFGFTVLNGESAAFILPLASFVVVAAFGWITFRAKQRKPA